jgi:hypothetical protein
MEGLTRYTFFLSAEIHLRGKGVYMGSKKGVFFEHIYIHPFIGRKMTALRQIL